MRATGIIRKIDELGRIVVPREIRKKLKIREGSPIEIYVENTGEIVLKKYEPLGEFLSIASDYVESMYETTGFNICISNTEKIIAYSGNQKKDYIEKEITSEVLKILELRMLWSTKDENQIKIYSDDSAVKYAFQLIAPIIVEGEIVGSVMLFSLDYRKKVTESEYKVILSASKFLSKYMEV